MLPAPFAGNWIRDIKQRQNDGHADIHAIVHLIKVGGTRVVIHILLISSMRGSGCSTGISCGAFCSSASSSW